MRLFTYGSLILPQVWQAVTGTLHRSEPGTLSGFIRRTVDGHTFPGILATGRDSDTVTGSIYHNVDPASLAALDAFESDFYVRQTIAARSDAGVAYRCDAYIVPPANASLLAEAEWDLGQFASQHLAEFLARIRQ